MNTSIGCDETLLAKVKCPACVCSNPLAVEDPSTSNRFEAVDILFYFGLLAVVIGLNHVAKARSWPVPAAILTMAVGTAVGGVLALYPHDHLRAFEKLDQAASEQFLTVWLAPIIFAEGYALRTKKFFDNITRVLTHAFIGTTVSAVVVALGMWYIPPMLGVSGENQLNFAECLAFGAMISATDPVTTMAIFKDQRLEDTGHDHLYYSVLGESVLNDAVGIALFTSFSQLVVEHEDELSTSDVIGTLKQFAVTFTGSVFIGVCMGFLLPAALAFLALDSSRIDRFASKESVGRAGSKESVGPTPQSVASSTHGGEELAFNVPEKGITLILAVLPYLIAESLDLSGIVAILFAGMVSRHYAHHKLSIETRQLFLPIIEFVAQLCETYVFIVLGLSVFLCDGNYSAPVIFAAAVGCLIGRAAHVYPFSGLVNCVSKSKPLDRNSQHMLCFAGLRGAIAFICAFSFPETKSSHHRHTIICTTIAIVAGSLVTMGWPTEAVLRMLKIKPVNDEDEEGFSPSACEYTPQERCPNLGESLLPIEVKQIDYPLIGG